MDLQTLWDDRYTRGLPSLEKPDPFFESMYAQHIQRIFPGKGMALDLAAGIGRHSHYLAARNWHTTAVDISPVAIERLVERSKMLEVRVDAILSDAAQYSFHPESLDLIVLYYHFDRALFPKICGALKPGGLFICKLAVAWSSGQTPPESMALPLRKEELLSLLGSYETLSHFEKPVRERGVVEYLGRK